ncbi:MAG: hypothetical protein Q4E20_00090 [Eubacteriales bacterium]|nr:hypothetical protein [Eubacteriales bacterium]
MKKEIIWQEICSFFRRFVVIYGFTMLVTLLFMLLFSRSALVGWQYFLKCVFFSLAADVPFLLFLSKRELDSKEWTHRFGLVVVVTEVILMPLGYGWMWIGWGGGILFFFSILLVNFGVRVVGYGIDAHTATQLNEQIRKRKLKEYVQHDEN